MSTHVLGVDENGLGAVLGPMIVTAVLATADESGARLLSRRPPRWLARVLDDSKRMVSHSDVRLGEAWSRGLVPEAENVEALIDALCLESRAELEAPCPKHVAAQCWRPGFPAFTAPPEMVSLVASRLARLADEGVAIRAVRCSVLCSKRLNHALQRGHNRFVSDLHAMERLVLALRDRAGANVHAVCGKVGGMIDYERFFGPLAGRLHVELAKERRESAYRFPGIGDLHFLMNADARHPLVMLASMVGKWVRETLMRRVSDWYETTDEPPSGYHDPRTRRFIEATSLARARRRVPSTCFIRESEASV